LDGDEFFYMRMQIGIGIFLWIQGGDVDKFVGNCGYGMGWGSFIQHVTPHLQWWHSCRDQPNSREKMHDFTAEFLKCVEFHRKFTERVSKIHGPHRCYFEVLC